LLGTKTYKHKKRGEENMDLTRGRGVGGVITEITNERIGAEGRTMRCRSRVMYRGLKTVGVPPTSHLVRWLSGSVKADTRQIQENCTTGSSQLVGSIQSEERFEGKTTHKGEETRRPPRKFATEQTGIANIPRGKPGSTDNNGPGSGSGKQNPTKGPQRRAKKWKVPIQ